MDRQWVIRKANLNVLFRYAKICSEKRCEKLHHIKLFFLNLVTIKLNGFLMIFLKSNYTLYQKSASITCLENYRYRCVLTTPIY